MRDATAQMQSSIWQFRTRTGKFKQEESPSEPVQALSEAVRECRAAISVSADVQEMAFNKYYPARIFVHQQRPPLSVKEDMKKEMERHKERERQHGSDSRKGNKVMPEDPESQEIEGEEIIENENVLDPEDPDYQPVSIDNHYSPMSPEKYIRFRLVNMLRLYRKRLPR